MKIINGNIVNLAKEGNFDVIVHGCNCFNIMGAGVAKQIKSEFPEAYDADLRTEKGDVNKMGTFTQAQVDRFAKPFTVVNAYTQYQHGKGKQHLSYEALDLAFYNIAKAFPRDLVIAYPKIGAGLGGGSWEIIFPIIQKNLKHHNQVFVEYSA